MTTMQATATNEELSPTRHAYVEKPVLIPRGLNVSAVMLSLLVDIARQVTRKYGSRYIERNSTSDGLRKRGLIQDEPGQSGGYGHVEITSLGWAVLAVNAIVDGIRQRKREARETIHEIVGILAVVAYATAWRHATEFFDDLSHDSRELAIIDHTAKEEWPELHPTILKRATINLLPEAKEHVAGYLLLLLAWYNRIHYDPARY